MFEIELPTLYENIEKEEARKRAELFGNEFDEDEYPPIPRMQTYYRVDSLVPYKDEDKRTVLFSGGWDHLIDLPYNTVRRLVRQARLKFKNDEANKEGDALG